MNKSKKFSIDRDHEATVIVVEGGQGNFYLYDSLGRDKFALVDAYPELKFLMSHNFTTIYVPDDHDLGDWNRLWLCCNVDCFSPPLYLLSASNESDAYEMFVDETTACDIDEDNLEDYVLEEEPVDADGYKNYSCDFSASGKPVDTEGVSVQPVTPYLVIYHEGAKVKV